MSRKATFFLARGNDRLEFCGDMQRKLYEAWVGRLPDKAVVEMSLQPRRHAKTNPQLGYWYGVLMPFAVEVLCEAGHDTLFDVSVGKLKTGVETNVDTCDLLFKTLFMQHKQYDKLPLKRDMTDEQMGELIDFTVMWLVQNLGVTPPEPKESDTCPTTTR